MIKVKHKLTKKEYYFRFFSDKESNKFWYTPELESCGFCLGYIDDFQPINITWKKLKKR